MKTKKLMIIETIKINKVFNQSLYIQLVLKKYL